MNDNFNNIDKSDFICLKFKDGSYYYGDIAYFDSQGSFFLENPNEEVNNVEEPNIPLQKDAKTKNIQEKEPIIEFKSLRKIRHGNGIQIYGTEEDENFKKYEGQWDKDKRNGFGSCFYSNGSCYQGNFKNDLREGYGKMKWIDGCEYDGNWKEGRLSGKGNFKTLENDVLSGEFKNNNFFFCENVYVSPFLSRKDREKLVKFRKEENLKYDKAKIQKLFQFKKVRDIPYCIDLMDESYKNERIPLIITSTDFTQDKNEIFSKIFEEIKKNYFEFNLREAYSLKQRNKLKEYMISIKEKLAQTLINDEFMLINIDDYENTEDDSFDPDLKEFYDSNTLPSHIWNPKIMARPEIHEKILQNTKFQNQKPDPNFSFKLILWSKFKLDRELDSKKIVEIFERRFSRTINLLMIDLLFFVTESN